MTSGGASEEQNAGEARKQDDTSPLQWRRIAPPLIACVVAGVAIAAVLSSGTSKGGGAELASVAGSQIDAAALTMDPVAAKAAIDEAKRCQVPLAQLTLATASGSTATIRVHSGSYVSPPYVLTDQPQRVAIPFPAAYPSGRGVISVEGNAQNLAVAIIPTWNVNSLTGTASLNVIWTPKTGC